MGNVWKHTQMTDNIKKIQIATLTIASALLFYAVGIATNFFANPVFSMFFIISAETAHTIVTGIAVVTAIAFAILAVAVSVNKKRKVVLLETQNKLAITTAKAPIKASKAPRKRVRVTPQAVNLKITINPESKKTQQKKTTAKQPPLQISVPNKTIVKMRHPTKKAV